jgi:hypothetical protein
VPNWQQAVPVLKLEVLARKQKSWRYGNDVKVLYTHLTLEGKEIKPWYNFDGWNVAYPRGNNSQTTEYDEYADVSAMQAQLQAALEPVVGLWVDRTTLHMVVYGNEAYVGDVAIRAIHVTIPITAEFVEKYFPAVPPPTKLF